MTRRSKCWWRLRFSTTLQNPTAKAVNPYLGCGNTKWSNCFCWTTTINMWKSNFVLGASISSFCSTAVTMPFATAFRWRLPLKYVRTTLGTARQSFQLTTFRPEWPKWTRSLYTEAEKSASTKRSILYRRTPSQIQTSIVWTSSSPLILMGWCRTLLHYPLSGPTPLRRGVNEARSDMHRSFQTYTRDQPLLSQSFANCPEPFLLPFPTINTYRLLIHTLSDLGACVFGDVL